MAHPRNRTLRRPRARPNLQFRPRLNPYGQAVAREMSGREVTAMAVPRFSDVVGSLRTALSQPTIRNPGMAQASLTLGQNAVSQYTQMQRQKIRGIQRASGRATRDKFNYGPEQINKVVARRRGTTSGKGGPKHTPPSRQRRSSRARVT